MVILHMQITFSATNMELLLALLQKNPNKSNQTKPNQIKKQNKKHPKTNNKPPKTKPNQPKPNKTKTTPNKQANKKQTSPPPTNQQKKPSKKQTKQPKTTKKSSCWTFQEAWDQSWKKILFKFRCRFGWCASTRAHIQTWKIFCGISDPPESQFIAQSNSLLLSNPTLWLLLLYNISLPSSPVKNFSCGAKARITVCPTYMLPFCALLDRVPRAYASFLVPFLQIFEVYSFSAVDAIILLVADMSVF